MISDDEKRILWCGNLSEKVTEEILYELFLQAAPVEGIKLMKAKYPNQSAYAFVTLKHINSVLYTTKLLNGIALFNRRLTVKAKDGVDFIKMKPILPEIPDCNKDDDIFNKLVESGKNFLHFKEMPRTPPNNWEPRNHMYKDDRRVDRHNRNRNDPNPYRNPHNNYRYRNRY